jgi:hypothetical protein
MSRINRPTKTQLAVTLSLAAIGPATGAVTLTSRRAHWGRRPGRYRSCISHRTTASTGRTLGSWPRGPSGLRCWPPAAWSPSACGVITSNPPRDRRAR